MLNECFSPKKNMLFEVHKFRQFKQISDETIDEYCTRLRHLAIICDFANSKDGVRIQLVERCLSLRVRSKAIHYDLSFTVKTLKEDRNHLASFSSNVNAIRNHQENQEISPLQQIKTGFVLRMQGKKNRVNRKK